MSYSFDNFDEIVFTHRNQDYGAYFMRKKYFRYLLISLISVLSLFISLSMALLISHNLPEKILDSGEFYTEYLNNPIENIKKPDDELLPILKKLEKKAAFTVPQIVNFEEDVSENDLDSDNKTADTTIAGTSDNGSTHGVLDGGDDADEEIYTFVQEVPAFPGGETARKLFIQQNLVYPRLAIQNKIQGIVYVSFVVEKDGRISSSKVVQGIGAGCDEEAIRVVNMMPKWKPGKRQGHEVRVQIIMPLNFILQAKS